MTFSDWLSLLAVAILGAISPGPSFVVIVKNTLGGGKWSGILTAWSHATGIAGYAIITVLGLTVVLQRFPALFHSIAIAGALYLAWLGWKSLSSTGGISATLCAGKKKDALHSMRDGIMISMLNPKIGLFFLAFFSQVMHPNVGTAGKIVTVLTPFLTDGSWYTIVALTLSQKKIFETLRNRAQLIDRITGVILILIATRIIFTG